MTISIDENTELEVDANCITHNDTTYDTSSNIEGPPLQYLIFDWGDTLVPSESLQRACWSRALEIFHQTFTEYPKISMKQFAKVYYMKAFSDDGAMFSQDKIIWMRDEMDHPATEDEVLGLLELYRTLYKSAIYQVIKEDKHKTFAALQERKKEHGEKMGILSDNSILTREVLVKYLYASGWGDLFDFFIVSEEVGEIKPHPHMFIAGLDCAGILPFEAIYFGNSLIRDSGSIDVGIPFVHISGYSGNGKDDDGKYPEIDFITEYTLEGIIG